MYAKEPVLDSRQSDTRDDIDMKTGRNFAQYVQNFWYMPEFDVLAAVWSYEVRPEATSLEKKSLKKENVSGIDS